MEAPRPAPDDWLERLSDSLREHEERRDHMLSFPPRYEVLEEISRGGMGTVHRAWDPQLGRNVALKVLRPEDGSAAEAHERFQREARLAASLHHPHIVPIYDSGTWKGQDYIAMQLLEGQTLAHARLDRRSALTCIRDAARALQFAHEQGIVHRDIKPSNLMLDANGRVYVADFGVARQSVATSTMTTPGTVVGTPAYMAPEQAMGLPADARSDVYSLGATLYELLTGKAPFDGDPHAVIEAVRTQEPVTARRIVPDLSKNVAAILAGAMERRPGDRYPSAAALADDIDRYLAGERPTRRPRGLSYRVQREFVRHPWRSGATILLGLLLIMAGIVLGYFIRSFVHLELAKNEPDRERRKSRLKKAEFFFPKEAGDLITEIERQEKDEADRAAAKAIQDQKDEFARKQAEENRRNEEKAARIREEADDAKRRLLISEMYDAVLKALADRSLTNIAVPLNSLKGAALDKYNELLPRVRMAEFDLGIEQLGTLASKADEPEFQAVFDRLSGPDYVSIRDRRPRLFKVIFALANELVRRKRLREAIHWLDEAERAGTPDASFYKLRGMAFLEIQEWAGAQRDFDLLVAASSGGEPPPPAFAVLPYRRGRTALQMGAWTEAIRQYTDAIKIDSRHALVHHDLGIARFRSGRPPQEVIDQDLKTALNFNPELKVDPQYRDIALDYSRAQAEEFWIAEDVSQRESAWRATLHWLGELERRLGSDSTLAMESAKMSRRLRNYDAALSSLRDLPESASLLHLRGQIHFEKAFERSKDVAQLETALTEFDRAVSLKPGNALFAYWRGTCQHSLGHSEKALEDLNSAKKEGLDSADLYFQLCLLQLSKKEFAPAIETASSGLARAHSLTEEGYIANLYELRSISRSAGIRLLERDLLFYRATAQFDLSDFKSCTDDCRRSLGLDPRFFKAYILRGEAACREKRHGDAQGDFANALSVASTKEDKDLAAQRKDNCLRH